MTTKTKLILLLTLMASGRAMTLAFIARAGDGGPGDPPDAWLMPLIGDAVIGLAAVGVALLIWRQRTIVTWSIAMAWSSIGAFDALAAYLVDIQTPWPDFFMLELFGRSMFFAAAAMHIGIIGLLAQQDVRAEFGAAPTVRSAP